jgi:shikimate dehydrogenase
VRHRFGLIGYPLAHSFSPAYFAAKFDALGLSDTCTYDLVPLEDPRLIPATLRQSFQGFNVTVPYKSAVIPWLNAIDRDAHAFGAVNTLARIGPFSWKGYNTDAPAFAETLLDWYGNEPLPAKAIVLGTGGSAKAVVLVLRRLGISPVRVSSSGKGDIAYTDIGPTLLADAALIVQCTPVGMSPQVEDAPPFPYALLDTRHRLYDLVYNPLESVFLQRGRQQGARVKNGLEMLHRQADLAWSIWQSYDPDLSRTRLSPHAS